MSLFISGLTFAGNQSFALTPGIELKNMDTSVAPGTDFYQFA